MHIEWTQEYKDKIGRKYLLNRNEYKVEELKELNIQELAFLIKSARYFSENNSVKNDDLSEKLKIFNQVMLEKIRNSEELYVIYNKITNYPLILGDDEYVLIYSDEVYAKEAVAHYNEEGFNLEYKEFQGDNVIKIFVELYRIGIENLIIDMSGKTYQYTFKRAEILPPPDWRDTPKISIPVFNPTIVKLMILYYQALNSPKGENHNKYLRDIADFMSVKMLRAEFLIPVKLDGDVEDVDGSDNEKVFKSDTHIQFPILQDKDKTFWTPIFTDWEEFKKLYNSNEWKGQVIQLKDALVISKDTGIVLNALGAPIRVDNENKKRLEDGLKRIGEIDELINDKKVNLISKNCYVGDIREEDLAVLDDIKKCCKKVKSIKKVYVRLMIQNDIMSYLLIVDFKGNKKEVFPELAKEITPLIKGMYVDMHEYDEWAEKIVKDSKPLYKRAFI